MTAPEYSYYEKKRKDEIVFDLLMAREERDAALVALDACVSAMEEICMSFKYTPGPSFHFAIDAAKKAMMTKEVLESLPAFFGCVRNIKSGEVAFVTKINASNVEGVCENGETMVTQTEDAELYDHPACPNSKELLAYFGW